MKRLFFVFLFLLCCYALFGKELSYEKELFSDLVRAFKYKDFSTAEYLAEKYLKIFKDGKNEFEVRKYLLLAKLSLFRTKIKHEGKLELKNLFDEYLKESKQLSLREKEHLLAYFKVLNFEFLDKKERLKAMSKISFEEFKILVSISFELKNYTPLQKLSLLHLWYKKFSKKMNAWQRRYIKLLMVKSLLKLYIVSLSNPDFINKIKIEGQIGELLPIKETILKFCKDCFKSCRENIRQQSAILGITTLSLKRNNVSKEDLRRWGSYASDKKWLSVWEALD